MWDLNSELLMVHYSSGSDDLYHGLNSQPFELSRGEICVANLIFLECITVLWNNKLLNGIELKVIEKYVSSKHNFTF